MPNRNFSIQANEIYHVYNRGVEKRDIFLNDVDYVRFIHDLFEFNSTKAAPAFERRYKPDKSKSHVGSLTSYMLAGEKLVEVLCFCLMSNHFHLLLRPLQDDALTIFMRKMGTGHTNAFNQKYSRVGALFQGVYQVSHVDRDEYLQHLVSYIHLNPLKFLTQRSAGRIDFQKTWKKFKQYPWSSHQDYLGENKWGSVIEKKFILDLFGSPKNYERFVWDWMKHKSQRQEAIRSIAIDM